MIVYGEGGTGKSQVIQTVTTFRVWNVPHLLLKSAYTGIAALLVHGKSTHYIGQLSVGHSTDAISQETRQKLQRIWKDVGYLVIDEYSMLSKSFIACLSRAISLAATGNENRSFGGISVILCSDLHQFPPVATSQSEALYYGSTTQHSTDSRLGRGIYEEFQTVVILRQQYRVIDPTWNDFLRNLRYGRVREEDIETLQKLVINHPNVEKTDFDKDPWVLVTP